MGGPAGGVCSTPCPSKNGDVEGVEGTQRREVLEGGRWERKRKTGAGYNKRQEEISHSAEDVRGSELSLANQLPCQTCSEMSCLINA